MGKSIAYVGYYPSQAYPVKEGDRVYNIKEPDVYGTVIHVDRNIPHPTTCNIKWDDCDGLDIKWTNKIEKVLL